MSMVENQPGAPASPGRGRRAALALCVLCACFGTVAAASEPSPPASLDGRYALDDRETDVVFVRRLAEGAYFVSIPGLWEGAAFVDGNEFWGAFHFPDVSRDRSLANAGGTWKGTIDERGVWTVHGEYTHGRGGKFDQTWVLRKRAPPSDSLPSARARPSRDSVTALAPGSARASAAGDSTLPRFGDYVYVEVLPEAITKSPPVYPEDARRQAISGTVMIQSLVGRDGRVVDAFVKLSIPGLDEAALSCVRQWTFKPAMSGGKPVAVWVMIPVKFTLR